MVNLTINGRKIKADEGTTILYAARDNNIYIPTLCENEAVAPYGACRLCLVETKTAKGRERMVTACIYQVEEGLTVTTDTEKIRNIRRMLLELLLARCPDSKVIQEMAADYGLSDTRFPKREGNNQCILCANCSRTCEEVVGVSAISLAKRSVERELTTPFSEDFSEVCIGCGSCVVLCAQGANSLRRKEPVKIPLKDKTAVNMRILTGRVGKWNMMKIRTKMLLGMKATYDTY